jgi:integrase
MPRRKSLTELQVTKLPRKAKRYSLADPVQQGLVLRVPPQGPVAYAAVGRRPDGTQQWKVVGTSATLSIDEARALARETLRKIQAGQPLETAPLPSVGAMADLWLKLKAEGEGYRTASERRRIIEKYLKPAIGSRVLSDLRRSDVAQMMDKLAKRHGKHMADQCLKVLSAICHWVETRDDTFRSPIVRGMRRAPIVHRERVLDDHEIRVVWELAGKSGSFGALIKLALLTGQRRAVLASLTWDQIDANGVWRIPRQPREKQNGGDLKLPPLALEIINAQPRLVGEPRVLHSPYAREVARFRQATGLPPFTVHDARRTARSLMSRAKVQTEVSELVLGHVLPGGAVRKTYDRHDYFEEKGAALAKLAALIERIVNPSMDNVTLSGVAS